MRVNGMDIHWVSDADSPEMILFNWALTHSSIVALDAEWKPQKRNACDNHRTFPDVSVLQLACRLLHLPPDSPDLDCSDSLVFLLDLQSIPFASIYAQLKEMFVSRNILKLGFRFNQDFIFLSSTFCSRGFHPGFHSVEPFIDISNVHNVLQEIQPLRSISKNAKSLATIYEELMGVSLSKELQCSDWSQRPLTEEQKMYAAIDAHCLLDIFTIFQVKINKQGVSSVCCQNIHLDESLSEIIFKYGSEILLKETDRKPKASKRKGKKHQQPTNSLNPKEKTAEWLEDGLGPAPWQSPNGGDGCPKFLCDVMIEGLAKYLRCVGIDAAVPNSKKPENRELIEHARKEKRVLLTRDAKLLRHEHLLNNQIYLVKNLLKDKQLNEVIETFQLKISEDQIMSRCTKCNGRFYQRPLTTEEATDAAKGCQKIPDFVLNRNVEFWQCVDCKQIYWEGTQYDSAKQKFKIFCDLA